MRQYTFKWLVLYIFYLIRERLMQRGITNVSIEDAKHKIGLFDIFEEDMIII